MSTLYLIYRDGPKVDGLKKGTWNLRSMFPALVCWIISIVEVTTMGFGACLGQQFGTR